ncbi:hypothetical protein HYC85_016357 [Camellia sinensis]|uniref:GTD-binding domain-containing protein n=1 Tax=Camellia sinensis TaxID=4442 RepID=A0A7J7GZH4_CAMSI|nr:hypothetical protein HYC85_016357 [Camellia sinensis]
MAARGISSVKSHNFFLRFTMALASAVLEWLLISMLFIDAIFSYLVTKFARYCKLQVPCLLCSRLDHVLGNEKLGFYWDLICGDHKFEISSFVLCRVHNKLADVHRMCESCLFSFATINKSNSETYRLLVGKLGADSHLGLEDHKLGSLRTRNCSCCNEPWILRSNAQNLLQTVSIGSEVAELEVPLSVATELWDDLKKIREEPSGSLRAYHMGKNGFDPLSNIEYTKVKITSDTESEVPFSDDDDSSALIRETADLKEESAVQHVEMQPQKNDFDPLSHIEYTKVKITSDTESEVPFSDDDDGVALIREASDLKEQSSVQPVQIEPQIISLEDNLTSEKLIHPDSAPELSTVDSQVQLNVIDSQCNTSVASTAATGHGLEELNWSQVEHKVDAFASVDEVPQSSNVADTLVEESTVCLDTLGTREVEPKSVTESGEVIEAESRPVTKSETTSEINPVINGTNSLMPNNLDLCDAYKFAVKGRQLSGKLSEQMSLKDGRLSEDLKLLLSQISVTRGIELPLNDMSPRVSGNRNEPKTDSSSSIGIQMLQRRISLERNESGLSLDGSVISEIEGESEIDRLKRQVEHDKKLLSASYKELEEERNASAISANQAMAMITRLQEEKAALNMEALQCVRMMEEQAEYDEEALQKANDFLAEREKEIQDLEAELELYRNKVGNTSILENELDSTCDLKPGEVRAEHSDTSYFKNSANEQTNNKPLVCNKVDGTGVLFGEKHTNNAYNEKHTNNACNSLLEFDDERLYILHCLKKLEKKLHLFSNDGIYLDKANGEYSGTKGDRVSDLKELNCKGCTQENSEKQENDLSMQKHVSVSVPSFENPEFVSKVSSEFDSGVQCYSGGCRLTDVVALGDAVSNLISRLEALEADHNSFDHFSKSLRMGDDEIKIHSGDILSHVREL